MNYDDLVSLQELKSCVYDDVELLYTCLDEDDIKSLNELREVFSEQDSLFIGEFDSEPDFNKYGLNKIYRNIRDGATYIRTKTEWRLLNKDGKNGTNGKQSIPGGGVGLNELNRVLDQRLSNYSPGGGGSFTGTIDSNFVLTSGSYVNISATTLSEALSSIDKIISNKILFGEYAKNDFIEDIDYMYVGYASLDDKWYIKRVEDLGDSLVLRYANISNNPLVVTYSAAINNRTILVYSLVQDIVL